jgi:molecular chaperone GrpE (heat shock protein)
MIDETLKTLDFLGDIISNELAKLVANEALRVKLGQLELLEAQNKDLKAKVEELTRENNNAKKEQKKAEGELEAVKKKQAEQWARMLLCVISTLTLSTTGAQKVVQKDDSVKPIKVYY